MSWFLKICDKLIERKSATISDDYEIQIFFKNLRMSKNLLDKTQNFEIDLQKYILKSIIINLIRTLEGFFKFYYEKMIKEWDFPLEKLANTIDKKIRLSDLVQFQDKDLHISELVAEFLNFQNLNDIDKIFGILFSLDRSLFDHLKDYYVQNFGSNSQPSIDIYFKLQEFIDLRHNIVHNIFFNLEINIAEIKEYITFIEEIFLIFAEFVAEKLWEQNNERGFMNLGFLKWTNMDYKGAIDCFEKTVQMNPDFPGYWISLGLIHFDEGNYHESIKFLKFFLAKEPDSYDGWDYLGSSYLLIDNFEDALKAFQKAADIEPNIYYVWEKLGLSYYQLKKPEKAKASFKKALEINNENSEIHWYLGIIYSENKELNKALTKFNDGLVIDSNDPCLLCAKGRTLAELGQLKESIEYLEKLLTLKPVQLCSFKYLAISYEENEETDKAISILERGMKIASDNNDQDEISKIKEILDEIKKKNS